MKQKQDNLQGFRGFLKREIRNIEAASRAYKEQEDLKKNMDHIKIGLWGSVNEPTQLMFIGLTFKKPLIPKEFITDLRFCLEEVFNEHF